ANNATGARPARSQSCAADGTRPYGNEGKSLAPADQAAGGRHTAGCAERADRVRAARSLAAEYSHIRGQIKRQRLAESQLTEQADEFAFARIHSDFELFPCR